MYQYISNLSYFLRNEKHSQIRGQFISMRVKIFCRLQNILSQKNNPYPGQCMRPETLHPLLLVILNKDLLLIFEINGPKKGPREPFFQMLLRYIVENMLY